MIASGKEGRMKHSGSKAKRNSRKRVFGGMTREYLEGGILGALLVLAVNFLFYRRWWVTFLLVPLGVYATRMYMKSRLENKKRQQRSEFREALSCLSVSLRAGYSVENAIRETAKDLANILGPEADMTRELAYIYSQLLVSVPVEVLLLDLAARSDSEDIESFAAVFAAAKKTGGSLVDIISRTARIISDKIDVEREIETSLAAKKYEQRIMSVMPCGIIIYMEAASPGFLDVMYTTTFGLLAMTGCLLVYAGAVYWGSKIVDIKV
jgi:tight adherence protein B